MDADVAMSRRDVETGGSSMPIIVSPLSHCYLDVPTPSRRPIPRKRGPRRPPAVFAQDRRRDVRLELAETLGPTRAAHVAGVEAAIWAETISDFDDLSFLLLPRLAGVAHRAWSDPRVATWADHRDRLARHGRLWSQDNLTYFRTSTVDWL
jgi:hexosaminidase